MDWDDFVPGSSGWNGSLVGALVSSFLLATAASFVSFYWGATWAPITFYLALFLILLFRPQGLFGKKVRVRCPIFHL